MVYNNNDKIILIKCGYLFIECEDYISSSFLRVLVRGRMWIFVKDSVSFYKICIMVVHFLIIIRSEGLPLLLFISLSALGADHRMLDE